MNGGPSGVQWPSRDTVPGLGRAPTPTAGLRAAVCPLGTSRGLFHTTA